MGKVRFSIYLYRNHDLDLITFMENHEFNLIKALYCALTAFSNDDVFVIKVPPRRNEKLIEKYVYCRQLTLDDEIDAKAIDVLSRIENGYKNSFLKNLLRQYLCNPISDDYLKDKEDAEFFEKKFNMFKKGKRVANAGLIKRKKAYESVLLSLSEEPEPKKKNPRKEKERKPQPAQSKPKAETKPAERKEEKIPDKNDILNDALSFINVM